jgi:hypothetical protein
LEYLQSKWQHPKIGSTLARNCHMSLQLCVWILVYFKHSIPVLKVGMGSWHTWHLFSPESERNSIGYKTWNGKEDVFHADQ